MRRLTLDSWRPEWEHPASNVPLSRGGPRCHRSPHLSPAVGSSRLLELPPSVVVRLLCSAAVVVVAQGTAPAIATNAQGGRKFRAFVKYSNDVPSLQELTVRPLTGRQVLMRQEAAQTCYTEVDRVLMPGVGINQATVMGHGGVGVVEAVGPQVLSTRVGDRVIVNLHAACGRCFNCLRMRSDKCMNNGAANPQSDVRDGEHAGLHVYRLDVGADDHQ